jgi:hypothetical protein
MEEQERRKKIIGYITNNPGSNKENIIEAFKNQISRVTALHTIEQLTKDNMIRKEKTKENSREQKLFVKFDNLLVSVPKELDEFETAYVNLLNKTRVGVMKKDHLQIAKELGIVKPDSSSWSEGERYQYFLYEHNKMNESFNEILQWIRKWTVKNEEIYDKINKLIKLEERINDFRKSNSDINTQLPDDMIEEITTMKDFLSELINFKLELSNALSSFDKAASYFEFYVLTKGGIAVFYLMTDIIFLRSMVIWPATVHDKEILQRLYAIVYSKIADIQLKLTQFLFPTEELGSRTMINAMIRAVDANRAFNIDNFIEVLKLCYRRLNKRSEFKSAFESLLILGKELEQYGYNKIRKTSVDTFSDNALESIDDTISFMKSKILNIEGKDEEKEVAQQE